MPPFALVSHPWLILPPLGAALAEYWWRRSHKHGYDVGAALASTGVALGRTIVRPITGLVVLAALKLAHDAAPAPLPATAWTTWAAGFLAVEFTYYWFHRASHRVRWMWATHAVHHSPDQMVLPSALRLGWTELLSLGWLLFVGLALLGFPPVVIAASLGINLLYQYPLHTEAVGRLGPLEWLFNTPSHHRVHHSSDAPYLDCNFGGVLILFDRLFGTFRAEPAEGGLHYGLVHPIRSHNPLRIVTEEWRRLFVDMGAARGLIAKVRIAFGRP